MEGETRVQDSAPLALYSSQFGCGDGTDRLMPFTFAMLYYVYMLHTHQLGSRV